MRPLVSCKLQLTSWEALHGQTLSHSLREPTATSATVTTATVPVPTRTGVKRAAEDPPDDTCRRDPQDDDDTTMDEFCVLERFEKERDRNPLLQEIVDEELEDRFIE